MRIDKAKLTKCFQISCFDAMNRNLHKFIHLKIAKLPLEIGEKLWFANFGVN